MEVIRFSGRVTDDDFRVALRKLRRGPRPWVGPVFLTGFLAWQGIRVGISLDELGSTLFWAALISLDSARVLKWRSGWRRDWIGETEFEFGDFEFRVTRSVRSASCRWSQLDRVIQTETHYLLILEPMMSEPFRVYLLPRRLMPAEVEGRWLELAADELRGAGKTIELR